MAFLLVVWLGWVGQTTAAASNEPQTEDVLEPWQENYLYMAPSNHGKGWGVFAAKSFHANDVIEVAPLWLAFENFEPLLSDTILDNYCANGWMKDGTMIPIPQTILIFGPSHIFNHGHGDEQNIKLLQMGDDEAPAFIHYAIRDIAVGEELLTNYGSEWFAQRGLHLVIEGDLPIKEEAPPAVGGDTPPPVVVPPPANTNTNTSLWIEDAEWRELYTSKIYAGHGIENCEGLYNSPYPDIDIKGYIQNRVAPFEAGYRNARTKFRIAQAGTVLEILPALIVEKDLVLDTHLEPIVVFWNDLEPSSLEEEVDPDAIFPETLNVLYKTIDTDWVSEYKTLNRVEETVLVPLGGFLSVLERTTSEDPNDYNCRLEGIAPDRWNENAFTIRIVATKPMEVGERLVLKMAGISASPKSRYALWKQLVATTQPFTQPPPQDYQEDENVESSIGPNSWKENYLYMAPSNHGKGWGVYAAKSFRKGDVVELAPMWVGFEAVEPLMFQTILNNYHAERWEWDGTTHHSKTVLIFGPNHIFNHGHDHEQNIKLLQMGDDDAVAFGHYALRDIAMGEELLANYGSQWFAARGLHQIRVGQEEVNDPVMDKSSSSSSSSLPTNITDEWKELYTSKIYAGHGKENCHSLVYSRDSDYNMIPYIRQRMTSMESGYLNARAKVPITNAGTLLEILPALLMPKHMVLDTLLEPIVLFWNDLEPSSFVNPDLFPKTVPVLSQIHAPSGIFHDTVQLDRVEETVLLPLGGSLAVLERTTSDDPADYNCRLEGITPDPWNENAFTIRIVATKPIEVGERLVLKLAGNSASPQSLIDLWDFLVETRQPLMAGYDQKNEDYYDHEEGDGSWTDAEADGDEEENSEL
jgi:uncharacterized protein YceK